MEANVLGAVLLSLASLVGLAVGVKTLFWPAAGNGNGTHDVTCREFEELKA